MLRVIGSLLVFTVILYFVLETDGFQSFCSKDPDYTCESECVMPIVNTFNIERDYRREARESQL
jgi:hypothetical protein